MFSLRHLVRALVRGLSPISFVVLKKRRGRRYRPFDTYIDLLETRVLMDALPSPLSNSDIGNPGVAEFMGGDPNQELTYMDKYGHDDLHSDLNDHLENYRDAKGNTMRSSSKNTSRDIQRNFTIEERRAAMADFYEEYESEYPAAASDFFKQHPTYRIKGR